MILKLNSQDVDEEYDLRVVQEGVRALFCLVVVNP